MSLRTSRVARSFGVLITGEAATQAIGFFAMAYLARRLGRVGFGVWVFAASLITYATTLTDLGTETWGVREVSAHPDRLRRSLRAVLSVRISLSLVLSLVLVAVAMLLPSPDRRWALALGASSIVATALQSHWALRAFESSVPVSLGYVAQRGTLLALALLFAHGPHDARYVSLWQGAGDGLAAIVWLVALYPRVGVPWPSTEHGLARHVLHDAWPIGATRVLRGAMYAMNVTILASFWPDAIVGEYGAAYRIITALLVFSSIFGWASIPSLARACAPGRTGEHTNRVVAMSMRVLAIIFVPLVTGGFIVAGSLVELIFGRRFADAREPLRILLIALLVTALSDQLRRVLQLRHRQRDDLRCVVIATIASVVANVALTPWLGALGAAAAVLGPELVLLALIASKVRSADVSPSLAAALGRALIAGTVMAIVLTPLRHYSIVLTIPLGVLVYLAALFATGDRTLLQLHLLDAPTVAPADAVEAD